ncbi:hypothetical protein Bbelb_151140 [Branchiostoma belcheri]|nr:hypothetical protein Bbelb_151140 [Branchiostoma belcheri]
MDNNSYSVGTVPFPVTSSLEKTVWFPTVHLILAAVGSVLNAFVIYIIAKKPRMRTYPNIFVLNIALADFLFCTVATPLVVNSVANPFLYALLGEKFGFYIRQIVCVESVCKQVVIDESKQQRQEQTTNRETVSTSL